MMLAWCSGRGGGGGGGAAICLLVSLNRESEIGDVCS